MQTLVYKSRHGVPHNHLRSVVPWMRSPRNASRDAAFMQDELSDFDAIADGWFLELDSLWPQLENVFPGSWYVLVERNASEWVESWMRELHLFLTSRSHGTTTEKMIFAHLHGRTFNMSQFKSFWEPLNALCTKREARSALEQQFIEHSASVKNFFASLPAQRSIVLQTSELSNATRLADWLQCDMKMLRKTVPWVFTNAACVSSRGRPSCLLPQLPTRVHPEPLEAITCNGTLLRTAPFGMGKMFAGH